MKIPELVLVAVFAATPVSAQVASVHFPTDGNGLLEYESVEVVRLSYLDRFSGLEQRNRLGRRFEEKDRRAAPGTPAVTRHPCTLYAPAAPAIWSRMVVARPVSVTLKINRGAFVPGSSPQ